MKLKVLGNGKLVDISPDLKNCKTCGHRNYNKCMLSGFYCTTERIYATVCGRNFEGWVQRPKRKGLIQWVLSLFWN